MVEEKLDHCGKDALTGFLGLMLQAVLAGLAFTCLIGKEQVFPTLLTSLVIGRWPNRAQHSNRAKKKIHLSDVNDNVVLLRWSRRCT